MPLKFLKTYNSIYDSYKEIKGRCKKPDIVGWTQDQAAKDYVACMSKSRIEHNKILRELKSYKSLRDRFELILKSLSIDNQLRSSL